MSQTQLEDQIIVQGELLSLTVFQEKLMRNFFIINSRLKKLESLNDIETKTRNVQKQVKFMSIKIDSMIQKMPKDSSAVSKKQVQTMIKDQLMDLLNTSQDKLKQTQTFIGITSQIQKLRIQISKSSKHGGHNPSNHKDYAQKQTSFTAGTILLSQAKKQPQASKQLLNQVLTKEESKIVGQIMAEDKQDDSQIEKIKKDVQRLHQIIDNLKIGLGYHKFVGKQLEQYQKYQKSGSRSHHDKRKNKSTNKNNYVENNTESPSEETQRPVAQLKAEFSAELQRNPTSKSKLSQAYGSGKSETIIKQDFLARKTFNPSFKSPTTLLNKQELSGVFINGPQNIPSTGPTSNREFNQTNPHFNKLGQLIKVQYIPENKLVSKAQRSKSLRKLDRVQKRLRLDDIKDINTVLKQIQLRLDNKANQDIFTQIVKQLQQKLQILRITKDPTHQISDLRKMVYNIDSKLQFIVTYLQNATNQDDALIVKKNWTCISCDKMVQKFGGKVGQHLNWDSMQSKKISPNKVGAFGQTGQLASKIKNLLDNSGEE